tara:strand:+ start:1112 stop:1417 length:306 start_codon:yes stop_codon:yes gene_type:complete
LTPFALLLRASKSHQVPAFFQPEYVTIRRFLGFARDHHLRIDEIIYSLIQELNGVVSAEHSIGFMKKQFLPYNKTGSEITLMKAFTQTIDPDGILTPGRIF